MGAGADMAMEDACIIFHLIAAAGSTEVIETALSTYDAVRRLRTQECIKRSIDAALSYDFLLPDVGDDMSNILKRLKESFEWLWYEDLEEQLRSAKEYVKP
jgi:salicylate hydroxylase